MDAVGEAGRLLKVLEGKGLTMCAAESCTGGLIGATITSVPGASSRFLGSAVTYANEAKERLLSVPRGVLFTYGAVSEQTARCMSKGAVGLYRSDVAVAVTGIAGPGGATADKPVGLVYISVSNGTKTQAFRFVFSGNREEVREQTVCNALRLLREFAEGL